MAVILSLLAGAAVAGLVAAAAPILADAAVRLVAAARAPGAGAESGGGWLARASAARRAGKLRAQLPEGLMAVSTSVRAGLSLLQAVENAAGRLPAPLGTELRRVSGEVQMGATLEAALANLESRVPLAEMRFLVAGLNLARSTGASLAPLLDRLVETLRERERLRGQLRTLTAQGRLSGLVVGMTPPVLVVVMALVDPEFLHPLIGTPAGWMLISIAIVLELVGALAIRAIVRVEAFS